MLNAAQSNTVAKNLCLNVVSVERLTIENVSIPSYAKIRCDKIPRELQWTIPVRTLRNLTTQAIMQSFQNIHLRTCLLRRRGGVP